MAILTKTTAGAGVTAKDGTLTPAEADNNTIEIVAQIASKASVGSTQTFTAPQRGTQTTDNDGSFDLNVTNNFKATPTGAFTLTFTNLASGQSGYIFLDNTGGYAISKAASVLSSSSFLSTISAAGKYLISYYTDGTSVIVTSSGVLT